MFYKNLFKIPYHICRQFTLDNSSNRAKMHIFGYFVLLTQMNSGLQTIFGIYQPFSPFHISSFTISPGSHLLFSGIEQQNWIAVVSL